MSTLFIAEVDNCQSVTCLNGATCMNSIHNFSCSCDLGYTGSLCQSGISFIQNKLH